VGVAAYAVRDGQPCRLALVPDFDGGQVERVGATRSRVQRVSSQIGGRRCRRRSSWSVFEISPYSDVRRQVLFVGVRSSENKPKGPRSVRGSDRSHGCCIR
jgi:hypothetical protein